MMLQSSARRRTGRWRPRGARRSCCISHAVRRAASRPRSILRWERRADALVSGGRRGGFRFLGVDDLEDLARAGVALGIFPRLIALRGVGLVGIGPGIEKHPDDRHLALLDR